MKKRAGEGSLLFKVHGGKLLLNMLSLV